MAEFFKTAGPEELIRLFNEPAWFAGQNHMHITEASPEFAAGTAEVDSTSMDPTGAVHKGVYATLMDTAAAIAALATGKGCVTLNCENHYLEAVTQPCTLRGEAHLISHDGDIYTYRTVVRREDLMIAMGTYTIYLL